MSRRSSAPGLSAVPPAASRSTDGSAGGSTGGFVLQVEAPDAALTSLVELAETLAELARDALPEAVTHTEVHPVGAASSPAGPPGHSPDFQAPLPDDAGLATDDGGPADHESGPPPAAGFTTDDGGFTTDDGEPRSHDGGPRAQTAATPSSARPGHAAGAMTGPGARGVEANMLQHRLLVDGRDVRVTHRELQLLAYLLANPHRVIGRDELMRRVWGYSLGGPGQRTIDVHIRRLRDHLGQYRDLIATVHGVGYRMVPGGIAHLIPDDATHLDHAVGQ